MNILITGGAGYIGSILAEEILKRGHKVIIFDNLQQGHLQAVLPQAEFVYGDICKKICLTEVFRNNKIDAVMHLAAETVVEYSMTNPRRHFECNVKGGINLLDVMLDNNVSKIIFSSSAAVYGFPKKIPVEEEDEKNPVNAYGESKLIFEKILKWYSRSYDIKYVSLRYFNASGASLLHGEDHHPETHLIPNVLKSAMSNTPVRIFGLDYPTRDGSCIRDYIHVIDIAKAHILALDKIENAHGKAYNLGSQTGYSVLEIINKAEQITGLKIPFQFFPRRPGDPPVLVASSKLAEVELGWEPENSGLENIIYSAWKWLKNHPQGYK